MDGGRDRGRSKQLRLFVEPASGRLEHGGDIALGRRKVARPIDTRRPMHLILRSSLARGQWSLRRLSNAQAIDTLRIRFARRFGVKVYRNSNAGNHLHLLVRARCRIGLQHFLRAFAGAVARLITGARRGHRAGRFWDRIAYSRVVQWGRDFCGVNSYVLQNEWNTAGFVEWIEPTTPLARHSWGGTTGGP